MKMILPLFLRRSKEIGNYFVILKYYTYNMYLKRI